MEHNLIQERLDEKITQTINFLNEHGLSGDIALKVIECPCDEPESRFCKMNNSFYPNVCVPIQKRILSTLAESPIQ